MRAADDLDWRAAGPATRGTDLIARAQAVAAIASKYASDVDQAARFPFEAIAAAREERLLGALVPSTLGGDGCDFGAVVDVCYVLGRACASTGLIYAMHQTKVACILRHHPPLPCPDGPLPRPSPHPF